MRCWRHRPRAPPARPRPGRPHAGGASMAHRRDGLERPALHRTRPGPPAPGRHHPVEQQRAGDCQLGARPVRPPARHAGCRHRPVARGPGRRAGGPHAAGRQRGHGVLQPGPADRDPRGGRAIADAARTPAGAGGPAHHRRARHARGAAPGRGADRPVAGGPHRPPLSPRVTMPDTHTPPSASAAPARRGTAARQHPRAGHRGAVAGHVHECARHLHRQRVHPGHLRRHGREPGAGHLGHHLVRGGPRWPRR
jgi:translation initiation factor IF-2